jgi:hypothetical protein
MWVPHPSEAWVGFLSFHIAVILHEVEGAIFQRYGSSSASRGLNIGAPLQ